MTVIREPWSADEEARLRERPYDYAWFDSHDPGKRTKKAFQVKREMLGITRHASLVARDPSQDEPAVFWDKKERTVTWDDFIEPMAAMQELARAASRSQDYATISIPSDKPVPIAFISDWHIGSWGTDAYAIREGTERLIRLHEEHGLFAAVLGDMCEMAIRLRSIIEISGNLLRPQSQMDFMAVWLERLSPIVLWSTWDNHAVQREEDAAGVSLYAELFKNSTIYHSGIGHTTLAVGDEHYAIATSHRFRGRSRNNPVSSQMAYIRDEAPGIEVAVAGDSHIPAIMQYPHGGHVKTVANCGTLQLDGGYAKRNFSLVSNSAMPVLVFSPDRHIIRPYTSLDHYEAAVA